MVVDLMVVVVEPAVVVAAEVEPASHTLSLSAREVAAMIFIVAAFSCAHVRVSRFQGPAFKLADNAGDAVLMSPTLRAEQHGEWSTLTVP